MATEVAATTVADMDTVAAGMVAADTMVRTADSMVVAALITAIVAVTAGKAIAGGLAFLATAGTPAGASTADRVAGITVVVDLTAAAMEAGTAKHAWSRRCSCGAERQNGWPLNA